MSAYLVNRYHIDMLIKAGLKQDHSHPLGWKGPEGWASLTRQTVDRAGRMLWTENLKSIAYRYPDDESGERPGPIGLTDFEIAAYAWTDHQHDISAVQALKALDCYEYQSCEHPEWDTSEAKTFCESLHSHLIGLLPGYDEAAWELEDPTPVTAIPEAFTR